MQLSLFPESHEVDEKALGRCLRAGVVAVDVETNTQWPGVGPKLDYGLSYAADVTVIGLAWREGARMASAALAAPFGEKEQAFLIELFERAELFIAHNAVFDVRQLSRVTGGVIPTRIWDTLAMARLLAPSVDARYSLVGVAESLKLPVPDSQQAMKKKRSKLHLLPLEQKVAYVQDDARLTYLIYEAQKRLPQDAELVDWECRAVYEYCLMAARGMRLNVAYVEGYLEELRGRRQVVVERLFQDGLSSPRNSKDRAKYLYVTKGLPLPTWPEGRRYFTWAGRRRMRENPEREVTFADLSTNSYVISGYLEEQPAYGEALRDLAAFQEVDWLVSTLEGLVDHAAVDGRLHSLVTTGTDTGRRSSTNPNLQNWKMPAMAGVAIGDEGATLVEIDYRNAENIMAALIAADSNLAAACATEDFHSAMGAEYFGEAWATADGELRKEMRQWSKAITYGTNYGMGARSLGRSLGVSEQEARRLMATKDRTFAAVTRVRAAAQREAKRSQRLTLWTGRPIAVPTPFVAWNYVCQGGVSEVVKRAIVLVGEAYRARGMGSRVALDMHDALILEVVHGEWVEALRIAMEIMVSVTPKEMNEMTNPAVQWQAEPDLAGNKLKWGKGQWHVGEEGGLDADDADDADFLGG